MRVKANKPLRRQPDPAILRLARALALQAAREDHAEELAEAKRRLEAKRQQNEKSRNLCPILD